VSETWTLPELVEEAARRIAALPSPKNGQVRAVPDERTVRYYAAIGLLDRPAAMRGRTALYESRHLAQIVAIKRLQGTGKSLGDIQHLWPTLDDATLARMSGVKIEGRKRKQFWKQEPEASGESSELKPEARSLKPGRPTADLIAELAALHAAAAPLLAELARRGITRTLEESP
jgi:DNA-binding transcriptional MerR regulator